MFRSKPRPYLVLPQDHRLQSQLKSLEEDYINLKCILFPAGSYSGQEGKQASPHLLPRDADSEYRPVPPSPPVPAQPPSTHRCTSRTLSCWTARTHCRGQKINPALVLGLTLKFPDWEPGSSGTCKTSLPLLPLAFANSRRLVLLPERSFCPRSSFQPRRGNGRGLNGPQRK